MAETRDTRRGIQNVQQRVSDIPSRETVGERHLRGGKWGSDESHTRKAAEEAAAQEQQIAVASAVMLAEMENQEVQQQSHIRHAMQEKAKKMLLKKALGKKTLLARQSIRATLWLAFMAYLLQVLFAIGSLVGFGAHAMALYFTKENIVGQILGLLVSAKDLPFEGIGYAFWGLGVVLSLIVLLGYLIFFRALGITILQSSTMLLITVVCFTFNISPGLNILPWLLLWVIYMSLSSASE